MTGLFLLSKNSGLNDISLNLDGFEIENNDNICLYYLCPKDTNTIKNMLPLPLNITNNRKERIDNLSIELIAKLKPLKNVRGLQKRFLYFSDSEDSNDYVRQTIQLERRTLNPKQNYEIAKEKFLNVTNDNRLFESWKESFDPFLITIAMQRIGNNDKFTARILILPVLVDDNDIPDKKTKNIYNYPDYSQYDKDTFHKKYAVITIPAYTTLTPDGVPIGVYTYRDSNKKVIEL
jgi:hypothetical protein